MAPGVQAGLEIPSLNDPLAYPLLPAATTGKMPAERRFVNAEAGQEVVDGEVL